MNSGSPLSMKLYESQPSVPEANVLVTKAAALAQEASKIDAKIAEV
jgi:hypothetical protein